MTTTKLLELLDQLEDHFPSICDCRTKAMQLRLSADGSGCVEAHLHPNDSPSQVLVKLSKSPNGYVAYANFESLSELEGFLESPDQVEWSQRPN